jgi:hypothetical protein
MRKTWRTVFGLGLASVAAAAAADDLTGHDEFVCTAWHAVMCTTEGTCTPTEAWRLAMPDFVKIDLDARELVTPEGTEQPRFTTIGSIERREGRIFLSGSQGERGYTWVINEESGEGSLALAEDNAVVTLFTACAAAENLR